MEDKQRNRVGYYSIIPSKILYNKLKIKSINIKKFIYFYSLFFFYLILDIASAFQFL